MTILDRFIKYIKIDTTSNSNNDNTPSSNGQFVFANILADELNKLQLDEIFMDEEHCYIYARLKGVADLPKIGFVSHLDTSSSASGKNINPKIIYNYDGKNVKLNNNTELDVSVYSDLKNHVGKTLITTDGTTLLGSDDKAGIAEIMNMLEYYSTNDVEHGDIFICFTPDEEIGNGTKYLNYNIFKPDYAYTVDGSSVGEFSYENFNAASATIEINGVSTHAGSAKGKMINSVRIATIINSLLPEEVPENTEGHEGFYHLEEISGDVSYTKMRYIIRDFDENNLEKRKMLLKEIVNQLNSKYGNVISLNVRDSYKNMFNIINQDPLIIENTIKAIKKTGVEPIITEIRGGTDGADISYMGIKCPNIGTGGHNFHSIYEYVCLEDMEKASQILVSIVDTFSKIDSKTKENEKQNTPVLKKLI